MPALSITSPYPIFTESDGQPLENGYIWIGAANADPRTSPITVYSDRLLTIPVAQPMRTLNGYFLVNGSPSELFVNATNYSILVQNRFGATVFSKSSGINEDRTFSSASITGNLSVSGSSALNTLTANSATITNTNAGTLTANSAQINGNVSSTSLVQGQKVLGISTTGDDEVARFQHSSSPFVSFYRAGSRAGYLQSTASTFSIVSETSQFIDLNTGGGTKLSVSSAGLIRSYTSGGGKLMDQASIRAWAKFNMQSGSGSLAFTGMGISSVVKNADNSLQINFSDPMPDANYAILQGPAVYNYSNYMQMDGVPVFGTTSFRINCLNGLNQIVTPTFVSFAVVR